MQDVLAFASLAAVIIVVPGPDMALVSRNAIASGRRAALETALGVTVGLMVWALAAGFGIAAILETSTSVFTVIRLAGAAYLILLGLMALRDAWRGSTTAGAVADKADHRSAAAKAFRQGLLSNLLNPKTAVVFTTLIPQFVEPGSPAIVQTTFLATVFIGMAFVWFIVYAVLVAQARGLLRRPRVQRALNAIVGTVLSAFGVRLALDRR